MISNFAFIICFSQAALSIRWSQGSTSSLIRTHFLIDGKYQYAQRFQNDRMYGIKVQEARTASTSWLESESEETKTEQNTRRWWHTFQTVPVFQTGSYNIQVTPSAVTDFTESVCVCVWVGGCSLNSHHMLLWLFEFCGFWETHIFQFSLTHTFTRSKTGMQHFLFLHFSALRLPWQSDTLCKHAASCVLASSKLVGDMCLCSVHSAAALAGSAFTRMIHRLCR